MVTKADTPRLRVASREARAEEIEFVFRRKFGVECAAFAFGFAQEIRKPVIALRSDNKIDRAFAAKNFLALGLRDAARDRDRHAAAGERGFVFHLAQAPEFGIDLVHRLFADVTGIEHDQIGVLGAIGLDIAFRRQRVRHTMRIVDVHLATVGFDVDFAGSVHAARWAIKARCPKGPNASRGSNISDIPWFQAGLSAPIGHFNSGFCRKKKCRDFRPLLPKKSAAQGLDPHAANRRFERFDQYSCGRRRRTQSARRM